MTSIQEPQAGSSGTLPLEVRAIGVLLVFELAAGIWFALNWPPGMSVFLSQIPAFGAVGMVWGFLPKDPKDAFSIWLAARLRRPFVWMSTAGIFAMALGASCFVNTVAVTGSPNDPTWIHQHTGRVARVNSGPLAPADSQRLRRGSGPLYFWVWTTPLGSTVWLRSSTRLTADERTVLPWRPTALDYPDDFEGPGVLAALPGKQALIEMTSALPIRIMLLEAGTGDTLAIDTVSTPGAVLFAFLNTDAPKDAETQWRGSADQLAGGFDSLLLSAWAKSARSRLTRRPLRSDERLRLLAVDAKGITVWMREVTLHDGLTTTLVTP